MTEKLIVSENASLLQDSILSVIKGKVIRALDLEESVSLNYTDTLLVYLSETQNGLLNRADLLLKIYGFVPEPGKVSMGLALNFCYGQTLEALSLPEPSTLDLKEYGGKLDEKIKRLIEDPTYGFKNAVGQKIVDLEIEHAEFPRLNFKLDLSPYIKFINVSFMRMMSFQAVHSGFTFILIRLLDLLWLKR